ncbi:IclR family transcriptional regulator, partial [Enterococcus lactis]|uniref:IclR family transcriptional regulator n=1 Tax=Enterococcus lactis TaxID=357441 RepID=UPI00237C18F9
VGMTSSTVLKILDTLLMIGYVNKNSEKNYRLGAKLIRYANKNIEQIDLVELTLPFLEQLQQKIDETIHLGVLDNNEILYVNKLDPKHQTIRMSSKIGITRPLYNSAMGKAVLAEFSEVQYTDYLENLKKEIQTVKETHVAFDDEEIERDIFCIGASIVKNEQIIGAFSVSMPKYRLTDETKEQIISALKQTKSEIEQRIQK